MTNYIRAMFCLSKPLRSGSCEALLSGLDSADCSYNRWILGRVVGSIDGYTRDIAHDEERVDDGAGAATRRQLSEWLASPGDLAITLGWRVIGVVHEARLMQMWPSEDSPVRVSLDVGEHVLFQSSQIVVHPSGIVFESFKRLVETVVVHAHPRIGVIDYEADLFCTDSGDHQYGSLASWGLYLPFVRLASWSPEDTGSLWALLDECIEIPDHGFLMFCGPLAANQAWTARHRRIDELLRRNL